MAATKGSAIAFFHEVKVNEDCPWSRVSAISLGDLQPINGAATIEEHTLCLGKLRSKALPCIVLYVTEDESVDELRKSVHFSAAMEASYEKMGSKWAAILQAKKAAAEKEAPRTDPPTVVIQEKEQPPDTARSTAETEAALRIFHTSAQADAARFRSAATGGTATGSHLFPRLSAPTPAEEGRFSPEIGDGSGRRGLPGTAIRTPPFPKPPSAGPLRPQRRARIGRVYSDPDFPPPRTRRCFKRSGHARTVFSPLTCIPAVCSWDTVPTGNGPVNVAALQEKVEQCGSWRQCFTAALYGLFSYAELNAPNATASTMEQTRLKIAVGLAREYCCNRNKAPPSSVQLSSALYHAKLGSGKK
ncbi:uncharacterized protein LOC129598203 isoform X2 [Paramacrobiotus metropolitanus]|uniref:uncharacterized protein LOC129598203 isoform X2 n=1 Tax=Paramacrobiotus metropolitanus TaxID=2943436 RepID=UPI002445ADC3|nr:uncharacterized protein LOC129598203 isoform X2 [Paramacrobiotus metropolitanus]